MSFNFSASRGIGVTRSPYKGLPRYHSHYGYNFSLGRMQRYSTLYLFGLHVWVIW